MQVATKSFEGNCCIRFQGKDESSRFLENVVTSDKTVMRHFLHDMQNMALCVCVCVCVCARARARARDLRHRNYTQIAK
jgi:hypothetical protein